MAGGYTLLFLSLPFIAAMVAPVAVRIMGSRAPWLLALVPFAIFLHVLRFSEPVAAGEVFIGGISWIPSLGINLSWRLDGLSFVFALLVSGIGALIIVYAGGYLKGHPQQGRFLAFLFLFMGSMLGLVMADNFFALLVLWELTSITSFLLIGFDHNRRASRRAALQALVVTGAGGLSLIAAFIIVQFVTGVGELTLLLATGDTLRQSPWYGAIFVLVLGGAFTKSAQFPLHFWLPNAMEAPTPVSAYLHSATMVKAGVYLLMRLNPVMGETPLWETVLPAFGAATLLVGAVLAVRQTDLKLMLAYTTVASLGLLVMLTGFGNERALEAAVYYLFAHSLFKGALFMVAGAVDHEAGTRDVRNLSGLRRAMPLTFAAAAIAALSMGGLPPLVGFIAKEEIYYALKGSGVWNLAFVAAAVAGNALMLAIAATVALKPFLGTERPELRKVHEAPLSLWSGPALLATGGLLAGVLYGPVNRYLISPMSSALAGAPLEAEGAMAFHIGVPLALSAATIALGVIAYLQIARLRFAIALVLRRIGWGPDAGFDQFVAGTIRLSALITRALQSGRMEAYVTTVFAVLAVVMVATLFGLGEAPAWPAWPDLTFYEAGVLALALLGIAAVLRAADRLTAIVSLGIQGFAVALIFMLFGAPDLSFTQFMVETLSVVILALVMTRLTLHKTDHRGAGAKIFDGAVAIAVGGGFGLLLLAVVEKPFDTRLSDFFAQYSYVIAHGRNIVNVIIVDFRGLDTLGEIAVVMTAGVAILALIGIRVRKPGAGDQPSAPPADPAAGARDMEGVA